MRAGKNSNSRKLLWLVGPALLLGLLALVAARATPAPSPDASAPEGPVVLHISHAEVVPELRGKGFSEPMVRAALDDVRVRGERVVSTCSYVSAFLESHPDYADLIAR